MLFTTAELSFQPTILEGSWLKFCAPGVPGWAGLPESHNTLLVLREDSQLGAKCVHPGVRETGLQTLALPLTVLVIQQLPQPGFPQL